MKFLIHILLILAITFLLQSFLPWWTMAIGAFIISFLIGNNGTLSFLAGFLGVGLLWLGMTYYIDFTTESILSEKLNQLLPVNSMLLTFLIGGIVGGFASLTGALLRAK
jgi:hypothetical protein